MMCHAVTRYISIGRPSVLLTNCWACYPSHEQPPLSDVQELTSKGRLHTTDDDIVLILRTPTPIPSRSDKLNTVGRAP